MKRVTDPARAVIYVSADVTDPERFAALAAPCLERVEACGYDLVGVVRHWPDAWDMFRDGRADVVVVAEMSHLPADRLPRVEDVTWPVPPQPSQQQDAAPPDAVPPGQRRRRPRRLR